MDTESFWIWVTGVIAILAVLTVLLFAIYGGIRATQITNERKTQNCMTVAFTEDKLLMHEVCK